MTEEHDPGDTPGHGVGGGVIPLDGAWAAAATDERLRRALTDVAGTDEFATVEVPGRWRDVPALADASSVLYRRTFTAPVAGPGTRRWLVFDGVCAHADVWLDGRYLGEVAGAFVPHTFEVTDPLRGDREHLVGLEVTSARPDDARSQRDLTGSLWHRPSIEQAPNPGGIWQSVRVESSGPVRIKHLRVRCDGADPARATVFVRAVVDADAPRRVEVQTHIGSEDAVRHDERSVAAGENYWEWTIEVPAPALWWPWALGEQPLSDVVVTITTDGVPSDGRRVRTGFRTVAWRNGVLTVNGERLFAKGAAQDPLPSTDAPSGCGAAQVVQLARDAGIDLLRLRAHVAQPELYAAADELGVMVWQDLPLRWGYARTVRAEARRLARATVDRLAPHPSVVAWCGHDQPLGPHRRDGHGSPASGDHLARRVLRATAPGWSRTVLDHAVARVLRDADGTRAVFAHAGELAPLPGVDGVDSPLSFGWEHGTADQLGPTLAAWPRLGRFVSEIGAASVPPGTALDDRGRWPDLDWDDLAGTYGTDVTTLRRRLPPEGYASAEAWIDATHRYQAELLRRHIETLRRLKYRPAGGFAIAAFADGAAAISPAVLDDRCRPTPAYGALTLACRAVIAVADWPPELLAPGAPLRQQLHVVNDLRRPLTGLELAVVVTWGAGDDTVVLAEQRFSGDVPSDAVCRVGAVDLVLPNAPGPVEVALTLAGDGVHDTRRYRTRIG